MNHRIAPQSLHSGLQLPPWTDRPVSRTDIVRYQGASGDFDAAHHDDEHARRYGFPGAFSLGLLHAGILAGYAVRHFGAGNVRRYRIRFKGVIAIGAVLTYRGTVIGTREVDGVRLVDLELSCEDTDGRVVVAAEATFVVES